MKSDLPDSVDKVRVNHWRVDADCISYTATGKPVLVMRPYSRNDPQFKPHPRGGATCVTLSIGDKLIGGWANCSFADSFCYALGREIALGRALHQAREEGLL